MKIIQLQKSATTTWKYISKRHVLVTPLVLIFGDRLLQEDKTIYNEVKDLFPSGELIFGFTCANITKKYVRDNCITITAIKFEKTTFKVKKSNVLREELDRFKIGKDIITQFQKEKLKYVFIVSEGSFIIGSELIKGMNDTGKDDLLITRGLCKDNTRYKKTASSYNEASKQGEVIAIGFYSDSLEVPFSVYGGWTPFGQERIVTTSKGNILFELDNKPALNLHKKYLKKKTKELPGATLLYPLSIKNKDNQQALVRSILNINKENNTMILAGDILENSKAPQIMTNVNQIANTSKKAATQALLHRKTKLELAILMSCIGRKLVLDLRIEEEIDKILAVVGEETTLCRFYSNGEIVPFQEEISGLLYN
jgi:hypothetical protein